MELARKPNQIPAGEASIDARSPANSLIEEQLPFRHAVCIADEGGHRQFLRCSWDRQQLQASLVWEAVGLPLVHVSGGPYKIFPSVLAAARARYDVVQIAVGWM